MKEGTEHFTKEEKQFLKEDRSAFHKEDRHYFKEDKEHINFDLLRIAIASEEDIREKWSYGEIKKPETINYRTFKPEKGGLFCEKIFGPTKDWECACGKYKKIKHKGIICDRCGVEVTLSKVRRQRMAHIDLAVPVVHIWFFKTMPSRIGNILGMTASDLERIIYYEEYVVVDPGETELEKKQLLNDASYREAQEKWGAGSFVAKMGGEAIADLLKLESLDSLCVELKEKLKKTKSMQARIKLAKRLKIIEAFLHTNNKIESMVLRAVPVIPPDLRPLVPLDGGRFATSDLNDLYRRVINRNNRLKVILRLKTPDVIVRNEKRMLQEAVDALFDNGRHGHPVMGAGNRPLKSLSEMLKGKQGRFRQNLLGKRVDYSGRSVIVVGPELRINQCGLPKEMALELFEPFIVKRLKDLGYVYTIRSAKKMIQRRSDEVWDVLENVIKGHPVLLNRAPTLHRLGIQAFEPVLIEGKAIQVHPLVCAAFNADFDGDQMAVHVPLSIEAQLEVKLLMMAPDNIFIPSSGRPVVMPSKDMTLGLYYLMCDPLYHPDQEGKRVKVFMNVKEVLVALHAGAGFQETINDRQQKRLDDLGRGLHIHEKIKVRVQQSIIETTPGRVLFNQIVPEELGFQNYALVGKRMGDLVMECYAKAGLERTVRLLDDLKDLGFAYATKAAISMGVKDIKIPSSKQQVINEAYKKVDEVKKQYEDGIITDGERKSKIISIWTEVSDTLSDALYERIRHPEPGHQLNPLFQILDSGARASRAQLKQLGAMRGLMAKPTGEIIEYPITSNFREGLTVIEFSISSHGARKGLADTALKTADSGYLTRRLVDVAQDVIITEKDCETLNAIEVSAIKQGKEEIVSLKSRIYGRCLMEDIYLPGDSTRCIGRIGDIITREQAAAIDDAGIDSVRIRSAMICESRRGICARCYGINLATGKEIGLGEAVGIIAAQSIGEPGTQLTMRTFHLGGIAATSFSPELIADYNGVLIYQDVRTVQDAEHNYIVLNKNGFLQIVRDEGRSVEEYKRLLKSKSIEPLQTMTLEVGTKILMADGMSIAQGTKIAEMELHNIPIICDRPGYVKYEDLVEGVSCEREINKQSGIVEMVVKQHRGELHPQIMIFSDQENKELVGTYAIPVGAIISVMEGQHVPPGAMLARLPRGAIRTKDITGGLPRVAELVEARKPKDAAEISKIDGTVDLKGVVQKNRRVVVVRDESTGMEEEHFIPLTKHLVVQKGDYVIKGQQLTDGLIVLHEMLEICGVRDVQKYLIDQIQGVYRLQGVEINDKHIEIIVRQMLQKVRILDPGDTTLLYGKEVSKEEFFEANKKTIEEAGKPAQGAPVLLGITKASLGTDSFISASSFQDTTRTLTEAACCSKCDPLLGFKESVITGHITPGGTGFVKDKYLASLEGELEFDFTSVN